MIVTEQMVETFKAAWEKADAEGKPNRSRAGLEAVFYEIEHPKPKPCLGYTLSNPCMLTDGHLGAHDPRPDYIN